MVAPLAIVQARMGSTRLPGKVLLTLEGEPLVIRACRKAAKAFGHANVVVAHPDTPENAPLAEVVDRYGYARFAWDGPEGDVLGRFYACAHRYRWHPDSIIVRVTPDDPWKDPMVMRAVAAGERHPVELGCEAFTLAQLDAATRTIPLHDPQAWWTPGEPVPPNPAREHITHALFPTLPPLPPPPLDGLPWSIDTQADYDAIVAKVGR